MEKAIYEIRPYLFLMIGVLSMAMNDGSGLRKLCGAVLLLTAGAVIRQRYRNRVSIRVF